MDSHWNHYSAFWNRLGPPLRPMADTVALYADMISRHDSNVLLYGVTPELAGLGQQLTAIDGSEGMIRSNWPGDTVRRRAILGNWLALPFVDGSMTAAIGDGLLNVICHPDDGCALLNDLARVLAPSAPVAFRAFCTPEHVETLAQIRDAAFDGEIENFHALKWRVAMARFPSQRGANIEVRDILARFDETFPDRADLAQRTGWTMDAISTIDVYAGSTNIYNFPTLPELRTIIEPRFENIRVVDSGRYPLSARCPLVVFENRR